MATFEAMSIAGATRGAEIADFESVVVPRLT